MSVVPGTRPNAQTRPVASKLKFRVDLNLTQVFVTHLYARKIA